MSEQQGAHTAGPWRFVSGNDGTRRIYSEDCNVLIDDDSECSLWPNRNADWQLIAAAPALLAACMEVANGYSTRGSEMARAAIAAATGEQQK